MSGTNIGATIGIVLGSPTSESAANYGLLDFDLIGKITALPDLGGEADVSSYDDMATGIKIKYPGVVDNGSGTIEVTFDRDNDGQIACQAGFNGANKGMTHSFELTNSAGEYIWFQSKLYGFVVKYGSTGDIIGASIKIEVDTELTIS